MPIDAYRATPAFGRIVCQPHAHLTRLAVGLGDQCADRRESLGLSAYRSVFGSAVESVVDGSAVSATEAVGTDSPPPIAGSSQLEHAATVASRRIVDGAVIDWRRPRRRTRSAPPPGCCGAYLLGRRRAASLHRQAGSEHVDDQLEGSANQFGVSVTDLDAPVDGRPDRATLLSREVCRP
jgi:hypothetical protein